MTRSERLHLEAMESCDQALAARRRGQGADASRLFRRAFELERDAAAELGADLALEPTRSIIHRSAASLAYECGEYRAAEKLIAAALAGDPPGEVAEELRDLLEQVNFRRHLELRGLILAPAELQMSLAGAATSLGMVETDPFLDRVRSTERLLLRTLERKLGVRYRERGRPPKRINDSIKVYLSTPRAASFAVTLRLGLPERQLLLPGHDPGLLDRPDAIVDDLLDGLAAFDAGDDGRLRELIPDEIYRRNFVALADQIAPDGEAITLVGFTALRDGRERSLPLRRRQPLPIDRPASSNGHAEAGEVVVEGVLRKADATNPRRQRVSIVTEEGEAWPFLVPPGMMSDVVKPLWDERVAVTAERVGGDRFLLKRIVAIR